MYDNLWNDDALNMCPSLIYLFVCVCVCVLSIIYTTHPFQQHNFLSMERMFYSYIYTHDILHFFLCAHMR